MNLNVYEKRLTGKQHTSQMMGATAQVFNLLYKNIL
jgi:hypothetical protein